MKKRDLKKLAVLGLCSGALVAAHVHADTAQTATDKASTTKTDDDYKKNLDNGNVGYHTMTEEELLLELNPEGTKMYNSLDAKGKELARKVASQMCSGMNDCAGLNACATDKNKCAGQGSCKGKSKCAFSDKNLAVKVVHDKLMKEKRANLNK